LPTGYSIQCSRVKKNTGINGIHSKVRTLFGAKSTRKGIEALFCFGLDRQFSAYSNITSDVFILIRSIKHRLMKNSFHNLDKYTI
jgi:hypothetical protein